MASPLLRKHLDDSGRRFNDATRGSSEIFCLGGKRHCDFANGSRLIYPIQRRAMRFLNMCANKAFSILFTWLLDQPLKDTLCETKVLQGGLRQIWQPHLFGDFDPFGDFDFSLEPTREPQECEHYHSLAATHLRSDKHSALEARVELMKMVLFARGS